ncbi:MAG: AraC family transcriptional regulator [Lachnospiraceae bacterium]|nr:AraC family transcriptional regulator [Lachnospiraceae bacterium]
MNENVKELSFSCWKYNQEAGYKYPLHCHAYYEISLVTKGQREEYFNHNYYNANEGKMFFFSPLNVHGFRNNSEVSDMILQFSPEFINANVPNLSKNDIITVFPGAEPYIDISDCPEIQAIIRKLNTECHSMSDEYGQPQKTHTPAPLHTLLSEENASPDARISKRNLKTSILLLELLDILFEKEYLIVHSSQNNYLDFPLVETVINTILSDPCNTPSLKEAADLVNISYYHFSRMFKKTVGINYQEYCNISRIRHAEELLSESDKSVSEIAFEIGYESNTSFIKSFKKYLNTTPSKYRDRQKNK